MKTISTDPIYIPLVCREIMLDPTNNMQGIFCLEDGALISGAIYEGYNTVSIYGHIWVDDGATPSREWYAAICDYPFNHLNINKVIGKVADSNADSKKLCEHLGYHLEARIKDYRPDGDLLFYTMTREQCHILNNPLWDNVVKRVSSCH